MSNRSDHATSWSPQPEDKLDEGLTPAEVWRLARKRSGLFLFVVAACTAAAVFYAVGRTPYYRSTAVIIIDPHTPRPLGRDLDKVINVTEYWADKEYFATQIQLITSYEILREVVRSLGLHQDASFIRNLPSSNAQRAEAASESAAIAALRARLTVEPQKRTRLVHVQFEDADPERARRVAAGVVETFVQHNLDELSTATQSAGSWLKTQLVDLREELENSELTLHRYKKKNEMLSVSYDDRSNMLREEITQLSSKITDVRARREKLLARSKALSGISPEQPSEIPAGELLDSPLLGKLRGDYINAVREQESLLALGKGKQHPQVQAASAKLETVRAALMAELNAIRDGVKQDLDTLETELAGLVSLREYAKGQALDLNLMEIEYKRLERLKDNNEKLFSLVLERSKESDLTSVLQPNNIRTVEAPRKGSPTGPGVPLIASIGLLAGIVLGLGVATARERLDRSIKSPDELERYLALPMLGSFPKEGANGRSSSYAPYGRGQRKRTRRVPEPATLQGPLELLVHERPMSALAEAARGLRTNITFTAPDHPYRRLLVASPGPGEGKTTIACWVAIAMAQAGNKTLLIDCDLRRPRIHQIFGKRDVPGVAEVLLDRELLDEADLSTSVPNLSVLTSGSRVPNAAEILGSESFYKLLEELSKRFQRVVIDSPPITAVTDATILSKIVDGTVFVVQASSTSRDVARRALRALRDVGSRVIGSVLNAASSGSVSQGSYYYYRGNYGQEEDVA